MIRTLSEKQQADLDLRFDYHPPRSDEVRESHGLVRAMSQNLAQFLAAVVPAGREQALALTACEEAMMWANAGIARHQGAAASDAAG